MRTMQGLTVDTFGCCDRTLGQEPFACRTGTTALGAQDALRMRPHMRFVMLPCTSKGFGLRPGPLFCMRLRMRTDMHLSTRTTFAFFEIGHSERFESCLNLDMRHALKLNIRNEILPNTFKS